MMPLLWYFCVVFLVNLAKLQPATAERNSLKQIYDRLSEVVNVIERISSSIQSKVPTTCNKTIGSLENAQSDWNPKAIYSHGDHVTVTCNKGYFTKDRTSQQNVTCHLGNAWSNMLPCSEKETCTKPIAKLENAQSNWRPNAEYVPGDKVTITCNEKYYAKNRTKQQTTCLSGNAWSSILPCKFDCPAPFEIYEELCLYFVDSPETWLRAKTICEDMKPGYGSSLVILKTAEEQQAFVEFGRKKVQDYNNIWIGARDEDGDGKFSWIDGSEFITLYKDFDWRSGQPNNVGQDNTNCVPIYYETESYGDLFDSDCNMHCHSVCQII